MTWFESFLQNYPCVVLRIDSKETKAEAQRPVRGYCNILGRWWYSGIGKWQGRWWKNGILGVFWRQNLQDVLIDCIWSLEEREKSRTLVLLPIYLLTLLTLCLPFWEKHPVPTDIRLGHVTFSGQWMEVICSFLAESLIATLWDLVCPLIGESQCPGRIYFFSLDPGAKKTWNSPQSADI